MFITINRIAKANYKQDNYPTHLKEVALYLFEKYKKKPQIELSKLQDGAAVDSMKWVGTYFSIAIYPNQEKEYYLFTIRFFNTKLTDEIVEYLDHELPYFYTLEEVLDQQELDTITFSTLRTLVALSFTGYPDMNPILLQVFRNIILTGDEVMVGLVCDQVVIPNEIYRQELKEFVTIRLQTETDEFIKSSLLEALVES